MRMCRACVAGLLLAVLMAGVACGATVTYRKQVDGVRTVITPVVGGTIPEVARAVNGTLESMMEAELSEFIDEELMELVVEGRAELVGGSLLSFALDVWYFGLGAVHPTGWRGGITFDAATGREVVLEDLFLPGSGWYYAVDSLARREVARQELEEELALYDEGCPDLSQYSDQFFLRPGRLVFFWSDYQFAPHSSGQPEFELPIRELTPYLNPRYAPW